MIAKLVVVSLLVATSAAASPCPDIELHPSVLTPGKSAITDGIVVAWVPIGRATLPYDETIGDWKIAKKAVVRKAIAPGLDLVSGDLAGTELVDKSGTSIVKYSIDTALLLPAIAVPAKATITRTASGKKSRHAWVDTEVHLAAVPPAGVVALVVMSNGKPVSFGVVSDPKSLDVTVFREDSCGPHAKGTVDVQSGASVQLAWVDVGGRMSKPSAAIKIKGVIDK